VAVFEIMVNTPSIAALIRCNKTFLNSDIQTGANLYGDAGRFLLVKYTQG
jgi:Tfp pilus assembly pilus retraction ATPase PilT